MNRFILASKITAKDSCVNFNKKILIDKKQEMANIKSAFARLNVIRHFDNYHYNKNNLSIKLKLQHKITTKDAG